MLIFIVFLLEYVNSMLLGPGVVFTVTAGTLGFLREGAEGRLARRERAALTPDEVDRCGKVNVTALMCFSDNFVAIVAEGVPCDWTKTQRGMNLLIRFCSFIEARVSLPFRQSHARAGHIYRVFGLSVIERYIIQCRHTATMYFSSH